MSIENVLTLGVAAAILAAAALLRLVILGTARLFFALSGKQVPWARPADEAADEGITEPRRERKGHRPVVRPVLNALGTLGAGLIYVLATLGTWMRGVGAVLGAAAASAYAVLSPRVASGTQRGVAAAGRAIRSGAIVTVATAQHLAHVAAQWASRRAASAAEERARHASVDEPSEARVIVLDREWDPLTDPLEDEPASQAR